MVAEEAHLQSWVDFWENIYARRPGDGAEADFAGWRSSYTSRPIATEEMHQWLRHTIERVSALGATRVVDVGVGVGLFLRELAPQARSYHGLDLSPSALEAARASIAARPAGRVTLEQGDAMAISELADASAELVIMNSVVQYFPSAEYFRRVLVHAVRVAGPYGAVFVGDVRDLDLLEAFHAHVQLRWAPPLASAAHVVAAAKQARADERQLCLATTFFKDFATNDVPVGLVRVDLKRGGYVNEISRFRYDVTLFGKERVPAETAGTVRLEWTELADLDTLTQGVAGAAPTHDVVVTGVPNRRLSEPLAALALLDAAHDPGVTAGDLQRSLWEHDDEGIDPEELFLMGEGQGRPVRLTPAVGGVFDAVFESSEGTRR